MLDSHPDISNPGEFDFLIDLLGSNGQAPDPQRYRRWLATHRGFQAMGLAVDPALGYAELMHAFVKQLCRDDKVLTMNVHRHFDRLPGLFPQARYIHLIRDPRDVALSTIGMGWAGNVHSGVNIWAESERSWDRLAASLASDRYMEVRYEVLLENLVEELTKICRFLDVDYSPRMLDYSARSSYTVPDPQLRYQWKRKCTSRELQLVDWKLGGMLLQRKYELSGLPPRKPRLLELLRMAIQDKVYRVRFRIRRYGMVLYLENLVASRARIVSWQASCQSRINRIDVKYLK